ncbi:hypothetical protein RE9431_49380 (plasmid) [Prescottella equi]|nr:hypothetical protein [Prescottella equi]BCN46681.1 hypothetical protein RE9414_49610 [Prescottella equi]BCN66483.1 hypothetical protein RE9431_49380 [Prescottella equi]BCN81340.1 hypothetical protein RE0346_50000 [Prescottella equi]
MQMGKKIAQGLVLAAAAAGVTLASIGVAQAATYGPYAYDQCRMIQAGVTTLQPGQVLCTTANGLPGAKYVLPMTQGGVTTR